MEREIGKVERVDLGFEDHMIFGWNIGFHGGGWGQGTGWRSLQGQSDEVTCGLLKRIVESFGVGDWKQIVGTTVWVEREVYAGPIIAWENLPTESGFRFVIADEFARFVRPLPPTAAAPNEDDVPF